MADYTEHYNLKKPAANDWYSVEDQNGNSDIIDAALHDLAQAAAGLAEVTDGLTEATAGLAEDKVDKVQGKGLSTNDYNTAEKTKVGLANTHLSLPVDTVNGVHGIRVVEGNIEYKQGTEWKPLTSKDVVKYVPQELSDEQKAQARQNIGVKSSAIALKAATDVTAVSGNTTVSLNWTDPTDALIEGYTFAKWAGTLVVRKEGSAPANENDGVVVVDSVIRDQYASEPFTDTGLINDTEYFYGIFPYTEDGVYNYDCTISAIPGLTPIKLWTQTIGLDYDSLDEIPETDMRTLMSKHASANYLHTWLSEDITAVDMFTANDLAMKWIGWNDYICDKLMGVSAIQQKLMASPYWERILKDHVPVMTSNTAPYGTASGSNSYASSFDFYNAFDGNDTTMWRGSDNTGYNASASGYLEFTFPNPICVKRIKYIVPILGSAKPQTTAISFVGYNGTEEIPLAIASVDGDEYKLNNDAYVMKIRTNITQKNLDTDMRVMPAISTLQFYGRSLNVSVPTMTSNTAPYGEAFSSPAYSGHEAYGAFSRNGNYFQTQSGGAVGSYVGYKFPYPICIKKFYFKNENPSYAVSTFYYQVSNDGSNWTTIGGTRTNATDRNGKWFEVDSDDSYLYHRIKTVSATGITLTVMDLNFFGVDYSDRTEKTYLYGRGVELVEFDNSGAFNCGTASDGGYTKEADYLTYTFPTTLYHDRGICTDSMIDLTPYSKICAIVEHSSASDIRVVDCSNVNESAYVGLMIYKESSSQISDCVVVSRQKADALGGGKFIAQTSIYNPVQPLKIFEIWLE